MDLLTPVAHTDAHHWAATLLAHGLIGALLAAMLAPIFARWTSMLPWPSATQAASLGYVWLWEGLVQGIGAGWEDAAIDTLAVACGAHIAWGLWAHRWRLIRVPGLVLAFVLAVGVWRRRKGPEA